MDDLSSFRAKKHDPNQRIRERISAAWIAFKHPWPLQEIHPARYTRRVCPRVQCQEEWRRMNNRLRKTNPAHVILSRKNIESLLHMLDNRDKARPAIVKGDGLVVEVQEDGEHYQGVTPGVMSWERT